MSDPIVISDGERDATPPSKRARKNPNRTPLNLHTDLTPQKQPPGSASTPLLVDAEPLFDHVTAGKSSFGSGIGASSRREIKFSGKRIISLESDSEDSPPRPGTSKKYADFQKQPRGLESGSSDADSDVNSVWMQGASFRSLLPKDAIEVESDNEKEDTSVEKLSRQKQTTSSRSSTSALPKKQMSKDEKIRAMEEKKLRKEQEKLQKAASKADDAEHKKLEKEKQKCAKEKKVLKSIVAWIDNKVAEGSVGVDERRLLSGLKEKGIEYRVVSNPIEKSIVWTMKVPDDISKTLPRGTTVQYVLLVYEAEDFCNLVGNKKLEENVSRVRDEYPSYTMCYLTNKLMSYVNKKEKVEYKDPVNGSGWRKPPIDEAIAKLTTHYMGVHSRHCVDEAEVADHIVRLTSNLASCEFRNKLTRLSVIADGTLMSKNAIDKHLIKESPWLKVLVAIPKVQPRYAVAVSKKYPSLKSLLKVYMDPNISVNEKEFLLKDLKVEVVLGRDTKVGEVCSKRIYRVLMSHNGDKKTDDVEDKHKLRLCI